MCNLQIPRASHMRLVVSVSALRCPKGGAKISWKDPNPILADLTGKMVLAGYETGFCELWDPVPFGLQPLG